ncbi:MAG: hypothetical protein AB7O97_21635 [Planctomycetota bacterium]
MEPSGLVPDLGLGGSRCAEGPDGGMLLFGVNFQAPTPTTQLFRFDGAGWTELAAPPVSVRQRAAVAFDRARGELVVFGGAPPGIGGELGDTWVYDGSAWTQRTPANAPSPRRRAACAYDERRERVVLWGGEDATTTFRDTWEWDGTDWVQTTDALAIGPPPAARGLMVYDDARQACVLLHGVRLSTTSSTYVYDGRWSQVDSVTPDAVTAQLAYDRARGRVVAYGQFIPGNQTWEWDGRDWSLRATGLDPSELLEAGYSSARGAVIAHGRSASGNPATFAWQPRSQPLAIPFGDPCVDPQKVMRAAPGSAPQLGRILRLEVDRNGSGDVLIGALGVSRSVSGGSPLPALLPVGNPLNCLLRVDPFQTVLLSAADPAVWSLPIPNTPVLLGAVANAQALFLGQSAFSDATNGLELQVGVPLGESTVQETFQTAVGRDALASGDAWSNGATTIGLGGSGRHGSFDPAIGTSVAAGVFEISTDTQTIPASRTLSGQVEVVTDGRFEFTDFVVPAGVTVRFAGSNPAIVRVRGQVRIDGIVDVSGRDQVTFDATNLVPTVRTTPTPGQPGSAGGPGGGRGGRGGDRCFGIGALPVNNGQDGEDVRLAAGHAYAAQAIGTGGSGSPLSPSHGLDAQLGPTYTMNTLYSGAFASGGGGGGFSGPGTGSSEASGFASLTPPVAFEQGGVAFAALPLPAGASSLAHFTVGGSGGGGGGSHPYAGLAIDANPFQFDRWRAGGGGTGGGGVLALRAGGDIVVAAGAAVSSRGGDGALISGDNPSTPGQDTINTANANWGIAAPGGGGSGGSLLLQSARDLSVLGTLDTGGGAGSFVANITATSSAPTLTTLNVFAGDGAPGLVRLEARGALSATGASTPAPSTAALLDVDAQSGSRSRWLSPGTFELPVYLRYELLVDLGGTLVLYSDDPSVGPAADDPAGPVVIRFQAASLLPTGEVDPATLGRWRSQLGSFGDAFGIGRDRGDAFRFDLVLNAAAISGPARVLDLKVIYR